MGTAAAAIRGANGRASGRNVLSRMSTDLDPGGGAYQLEVPRRKSPRLWGGGAVPPPTQKLPALQCAAHTAARVDMHERARAGEIMDTTVICLL